MRAFIARFLAAALFVGLVPGGIYVAILGSRAGLYPYTAVPVVFGVVFAAALVAGFVVITKLRD